VVLKAPLASPARLPDPFLGSLLMHSLSVWLQAGTEGGRVSLVGQLELCGFSPSRSRRAQRTSRRCASRPMEIEGETGQTRRRQSVPYTRKQREKTVDDLINGVYGLAVIAGLLTYLSTRSWVTALGVLLVLVCALAVVVRLFRNRRMKRLRLSNMEGIVQMSGEDFEEVLLTLFRGKGYRAQLTPNGADFGADLLLERAGKRTVVQAKRWGRPVGVKAVQEIVAARAHYKAHEALVATNSSFTQQAITLAKSNHVELWDRERFIRELPAVASRQRDSVRASVGASHPRQVRGAGDHLLPGPPRRSAG